jgi:hypothetical protein
MLHCRSDDVPFPGIGFEARANRRIVALGGARREDDLARLRAYQFRDLRLRCLDYALEL